MVGDFVVMGAAEIADPEDFFGLGWGRAGQAGPAPAEVGGDVVFVPEVFEAFSAGGWWFGLDAFVAVGAA